MGECPPRPRVTTRLAQDQGAEEHLASNAPREEFANERDTDFSFPPNREWVGRLPTEANVPLRAVTSGPPSGR